MYFCTGYSPTYPQPPNVRMARFAAFTACSEAKSADAFRDNGQCLAFYASAANGSPG